MSKFFRDIESKKEKKHLSKYFLYDAGMLVRINTLTIWKLFTAFVDLRCSSKFTEMNWSSYNK
jgi:hypothetical protein